MAWSAPRAQGAGRTETAPWLCLTSARNGPTPPLTLSPQVCVSIFSLLYSLLVPTHQKTPTLLHNSYEPGTAKANTCFLRGTWSQLTPSFWTVAQHVCTFLDSWTDDGRYQCDIGWQNFQAGCYRLNVDKQDWNSAEKTCQKMDAHLVSIHTLPELEFINMHMKRGAKTHTHTYIYNTLSNYFGV